MIYKTLYQTNDSDFHEAVLLYQEAFPPEEQQSVECLQKRMEADQGQFLIAKENGRVIALAVLWNLSNGSFTLLEYFAISQTLRGKGFGSIFLKQIIQIAQSKNRSLIAELEDPKFGTNTTQRLKRVYFYQKNGFKQLNKTRSYVPALKGATPTEVILLVYPFAKEEFFSQAEITQVILSIFREIYQLPESNPLVQDVILTIPEQDFLQNQ